MIDSLSIIVPVHNAQSSLADQVRDLLELLPDLTPRFQVVVVDDGSTDQTLEVAQDLARLYPQVTALGTRSRKGHAAAAEAGLRQATGEIIFIQQTDRPVGSSDLFRLWEMRRDRNPRTDHNPRTGRGHLRPLEAGLIQRLTRWGRSLCDPAPESPAPKSPAPKSSVSKSPVSKSQPADALPVLGRGEFRWNTQAADEHLLLDLSVKALYS